METEYKINGFYGNINFLNHFPLYPSLHTTLIEKSIFFSKILSWCSRSILCIKKAQTLILNILLEIGSNHLCDILQTLGIWVTTVKSSWLHWESLLVVSFPLLFLFCVSLAISGSTCDWVTQLSCCLSWLNQLEVEENE